MTGLHLLAFDIAADRHNGHDVAFGDDPTDPTGLSTRSTPISSAASSFATSRSESCCSTLAGGRP